MPKSLSLDGWEIGTVPVTTDMEWMKPCLEGSMINRSIGLGVSSFSVPGDDDGEMYEAVFNVTHLATGLKLVAITANIGAALGMIAAIASLTDWTKEAPENLVAVAFQVREIVGDAAWLDTRSPVEGWVGHA
jgi:hypothetical protein